MKVVRMTKVIDIPVGYSAWSLDRSGQVQVVSSAVQRERMLRVYIDDRLSMKISCSSSDLADLVIGRLYTEGWIGDVGEIDSIKICERTMEAEVHFTGAESASSSGDGSPICADGLNFKLEPDAFCDNAALESVVPKAWDPEWVFSLVDLFAEDKTSHKETRGTHSAYLSQGGALLYQREDIGRHNALDKVFGAALADGVDLEQCLVLTSGRVPTDMVTKTIRARIPIMVSKAVPTDRAIKLARDYDLTLICTANPDFIEVFSDPCGIVGSRCERSQIVGFKVC